MRISDQERREVARRLREIREDEYGEVYMYDVMLALGIESGKAAYWADKEFIHHLADLIDRETCHLVEDDDGRTACSECGCAALCMLDASYCPECGRKVVRDGI